MSFRRIISQQLVHISQEFSKSLVKLFSQLKTPMIKVLPFLQEIRGWGQGGILIFYVTGRSIRINFWPKGKKTKNEL